MKFLKETVAELKAVTWPSGSKLRKDVLIVIQTTILLAIFFGVVDYVLNFAITSLVK